MINYSECCGKYIATTKIFKSKNILQTSKLVEGADYHCSRCKQRTTPAGNLKTEVATNCDPLKNNGNGMKIITSNSSSEQIQNALKSKEPMLFSSDEETRKKIKEQVDLLLIKIRAQRKNAAN